MTVVTKKVNYSAFCQTEFDESDTHLYKLLNGRIVKKSSTKPEHQRVLKKRTKLMDNYGETNKFGEVIFAPIDVFLDEYNVPKPDLVYIGKKNFNIIDEERGLIGIPDLVLEILSPSSIRRDRIEKKELYEKFAVPEYWIVDPNNRTIEIYTFDKKEKRYKLYSFGIENEKIKSKGLEIDLKSVLN